jgi:hypothetical protein
MVVPPRSGTAGHGRAADGEPRSWRRMAWGDDLLLAVVIAGFGGAVVTVARRRRRFPLARGLEVLDSPPWG